MRALLTDRIAVSLFFFVVLGIAVVQALGFDPEARLIPLAVGIPSFVLSAAVLLTEITGRRRETREPGVAGRELAAIAWLVVLVALIALAGLVWSIPVFLALFLRLQGREPWRIVVGVSLGAWAAIYVLFVLILQMELYGGVLQDLWGG